MILVLISIALLLSLSALFSGSETGIYSLSRLRLEAAVREGRPAARLVRWLLRDDALLLVTILIGNNLMLELLTWVAEEELVRSDLVPRGAVELLLAAVLTPVVYFFGELLPKELFRRRPQSLLFLIAPVLAGARALLFVLAWPLRWLSTQTLRLSGLGNVGLKEALGREAVLELFTAGTQSGALEPEIEALARNALNLRATSLESEMVPWPAVEALELEAPPEESRQLAARSSFSRLPVVDREGRVRGYVHQLDVLAAPEGTPLAEHLRSLPSLAPGTAVDRALSTLRTRGKRMALVGEAEAPRGLVTLKDLVETISGELAGF